MPTTIFYNIIFILFRSIIPRKELMDSPICDAHSGENYIANVANVEL